MKKETIKTKTAKFQLAPDGFSIHTFELSRKLDTKEYHDIKSSLYEGAEQTGGVMYKEKEGRHICGLYTNYGIRLFLEHNTKTFDTYFIRMTVNPRKLIDPDCSYLGILKPTESSIDKLCKAFRKLFRDTKIENDINAYHISRLDFCTNIHCDNRSIFRELVRVLRKLPTPAKYERMLKAAAPKTKDKKKAKKEANLYNKHYVKFACGTHALVIYDKTYQIENEGLKIGYEKLPKGVLRFEVQCEREYLRKLGKKLEIDETRDLLWALTQESQDIITKHFSQCWGDVPFYQLDTLKARIRNSRYSVENKELQLKLVKKLQRVQSVDKALDKLNLSDDEGTKLLKQFKKMKMSPIPLRKNFCADTLFGPVALLKRVANGDTVVTYRKK